MNIQEHYETVCRLQEASDNKFFIIIEQYKQYLEEVFTIQWVLQFRESPQRE